jgi:hypothetical protein
MKVKERLTITIEQLIKKQLHRGQNSPGLSKSNRLKMRYVIKPTEKLVFLS